MTQLFSIQRLITGLLTFMAMAMAQASTPVWTFTPLTDTSIYIAPQGIKFIQYLVTNQSKRTHTLMMQPIRGIQQVTTSGNCSNPFTLAYQQSCILNLEVKAQDLNGNTLGGPRVCQQGGTALQCYQPSAANSLNITIVPSNLRLTATPSTYAEVGIFYSQANTATGGALPYTFSLFSGGLPTGTSLNTTTGTVSGVPTVAMPFSYIIEVTDNDGATATASSEGAIIAALSATLTPSSLSVDSGQTATFTANPVGGTAPYSYQWYACTTFACTSKTLIPSATNSIYNPPTATAGTSYYQAIVTDAATATATSNVAILTVDNALSATATPSSLSLNSGQTATFTANPIGGTAPYGYQWYACTTSACTSVTVIPGATNSTYNPPTATAGTYYYQAIVTDATTATATTNVATLTVNNALSATATPSSLSLNSGQTATFTANPIGGTAPYGYQWYACTTSACTSVTVIPGATNSTYNPPTATAGTYYYQAIVTDATTATATTNVATLTVNNALSATATPSSLSVSSGQTATFTANPVGGTAPYGYQWYSCTTAACTSPTIIPQATSNTYSPSTSITGTYYYQAIVTDATMATATTNVVILTVNNALSATVSPSSLTVNAGQTATFTANPIGGTAPYTYQWYSCTNSTCTSVTVIPGATGNTYSPSTAIAGTYYYQAIVTDAAMASATTQSATLTITAQFTYVSDVSANLWQCQTNATGGFSGACTGLTNIPPFFITQQITFAIFSGTTYGYVSDFSQTLWKCPMKAGGGFSSACTGLSNTPTPFTATTGVAFATFSGTTYAYVADSSSNPAILWQCPMNATGNFSNICTALSGAFSLSNSVIIATFSGTTYAYVSDLTSNLWQCPMNATGGFSGPCNPLSSGFSQTANVDFATFSGTTYGYVADFSQTLWKCPMDATGGFTACTGLTNAGFNAVYDISFATFSGITYGYVTDASSTVWQCPMNSATGDFSGPCTTLTNTPAFVLTATVTSASF